DAMAEVVKRLTHHLGALGELDLAIEQRTAVVRLIEALGPALAAARMPTGVGVRRAARELRPELDAAGIPDPADHALTLVEIGGHADTLARLLDVCAGPHRAALIPVAVGSLAEYVNLHRNALTIQNAIRRIQRIVGALKTYSHLDQQATATGTDLHEGI